MSDLSHSAIRTDVETCTDSEEGNPLVARNEKPKFACREWGTAREEYGHDRSYNEACADDGRFGGVLALVQNRSMKRVLRCLPLPITTITGSRIRKDINP